MAILSPADMAGALAQAGWPADLIPTMVAVGLGESSGRTDALNNSGREYSVGLWQINLRAHPEYDEAQLQDPVTNARAALDIYRRQGLSAWGAYTNGSYRKYLAQAQQAVSGAAGALTTAVTQNTPQLAGLFLLALGLILIHHHLRDG